MRLIGSLRLAAKVVVPLFLMAATGSLPPAPGSTPEAREGGKTLNAAVMVGGGPAEPFLIDCAKGNQAACDSTRDAQSKRAEWQAESQKAMRRAFDLLAAACARNDAEGCAVLAFHPSVGTLMPAPVASSRQAMADKAARLLQLRCSETGDRDNACVSYKSFLDQLRTNDHSFAPAERIPGLAHLTADGGRILAARCLAGDDYFCGDAQALLEAGPPQPLHAFHAARCRQEVEASCHAIGQKTAYDREHDARAAAQVSDCENGATENCTLLAYNLWSGPHTPASVKQAIAYAGKACAGNFGLGCLLLASALVDPAAGRDYPAAADAFGKACKLLKPAEGQQAACSNEQKIRAALARPK